MSGKRQDGSRAPIKPLREFLTEASPNRDCIVKLIKDNIGEGVKSIALCFRGYYASLYYRCGQLLKIESTGRTTTGIFDFNYALPYPERQTVQSMLEGLGVRFGKKYARIVLKGNGEVSANNLKIILQTYIKLIDFWVSVKKTKGFREKDRQQQLFAVNFGKGNQTYFDIEYTEPRETLIAAGYYANAEDKIAAHKNDRGGRFDLLGLRHTDGGYILQFVELKTTVQACGNSAGVYKHISDYKRYCDKKTLVEARKAEAAETINLLSEIFGGQFFPEKLTKDKITDYEIIFIFTDKSVRYAEQYKDSISTDKVKIVCYDENLNVIS